MLAYECVIERQNMKKIANLINPIFELFFILKNQEENKQLTKWQ